MAIMELKGGYVIRRFERDDLDQVVRINKSCLPENYPNSFFLGLHFQAPNAFIVAEKDDKVVGYVMCRVERGFSNFGMKIVKKGHIVSLAVLPEHRRRKVAEKLLSEALKGLKGYDVNEVYLEVRVSNEPAINLYKKFGFEVVKRQKGYYLDGEDAFVMSVKM